MRISDCSSDVCSSDLLNLVTPWHLFPHLIPNPRVEIVSHSIHYLDTIRALAGDPKGVFARSYAHPSSRLSRSEERRVGKSMSVRVDLGGRRIINKKS